MKQDAEGSYVADIVDRQLSPPRSMPSGSFRKLYTISPNSRYFLGSALLVVALEGLFLYFRLERVHGTDTPFFTFIMGLTALSILLPLGLPLINARKISRAIQYGVSAIGTVESVQEAQTGAYSTPAGMNNGAIQVMVSYTLNGQQHRSKLFLDRPWIGNIAKGSQIQVLIDPDKPSKPYVVGMADQRLR